MDSAERSPASKFPNPLLYAAGAGVALLAAAWLNLGFFLGEHAAQNQLRGSVETAIAMELAATGATVQIWARTGPEEASAHLSTEPRLDWALEWRDGRLRPYVPGLVGGSPPAEAMTVIESLLNARTLDMRDGPELRGMEAPPPADAAASLFTAGGRAYAIAIAPLEAAGPGEKDEALLVGVDTFDQGWLARVAAEAGGASISLARPGSAEAIYTPASLGGGEIKLSLESPAPPQRFTSGLSAVLATLAMAIGFAYVVSARRVARNLSASEARARHQASHDSLLELPNRVLFRAKLEEAVKGAARAGERHGLLYLDLDNFKEINDSLGHEGGDRLLIEFATRMRSTLGPNDMIARIGGDEFAILCRNVRDRTAVKAIAKAAMAHFAEPFEIGERKVMTSASIGIALAPDDASTPEDWMRQADIALYRAKKEGRGRYQFFERWRDDEPRIRQVVERELRAAINDNKFQIHYQPIFSADAKRVACVEALLSWRHPVHGYIPPDLIVHVAEERGLSPRLGEWVMRRACSDAAAWRGVTLAVNISAVQFRDRDFFSQIASVLMETRFEPSRLELELREGALIADADKAEDVMIAMRKTGVRMALDGFGAGYSSLIYLRRFPFDKIKLDRAFLESIEPAGESFVLLESVVKLGRALGLTVTADGVETRGQLGMLHRIGCDQYQGFLLARPMTAVEIGALLARLEAPEPTARQQVA